ncbi:hypothetical protein [Streptomyces hygroscopicus]|uniref:hypothetical protein n=1 Tax=Streptomyces hygroscopicus TaxID=1912 RepID=UPI001FCBB712|nr:hypothetical protein [Streptomyces hygroscopicus]BDH12762.1 hypothetical protein HOK021_39410 [Streptomyces hygroscopicus]
MTAGWCSRTVRAAVFAAVCVLLAALGHVMMSGSRVPAWVLAAGLTVSGAAGWCLAGRERGLPLIVTVVVAAQTGWLAAPLRLLLLLAPPIVPDRLRVRVRRPQSDHAPRLLLLVHAITSRGPPAGTAVI